MPMIAYNQDNKIGDKDNEREQSGRLPPNQSPASSGSSTAQEGLDVGYSRSDPLSAAAVLAQTLERRKASSITKGNQSSITTATASPALNDQSSTNQFSTLPKQRLRLGDAEKIDLAVEYYSEHQLGDTSEIGKSMVGERGKQLLRQAFTTLASGDFERLGHLVTDMTKNPEAGVRQGDGSNAALVHAMYNAKIPISPLIGRKPGYRIGVPGTTDFLQVNLSSPEDIGGLTVDISVGPRFDQSWKQSFRSEQRDATSWVDGMYKPRAEAIVREFRRALDEQLPSGRLC